MQVVRERLSAETNEALNEQERQLGLLIARLQVGQARRLAIIQKQDKTIKELEVGGWCTWGQRSQCFVFSSMHFLG